MKPWPKNILMVKPNGFRVEYAINPYMLDERGELQKVDTARASAQWEELKAVFERLGQNVEVLEGNPEFPDMVFCANQTLPFTWPDGKPGVALGRMHSTKRRGESAAFLQWAKSKGFSILNIHDHDFEGAGDGIWNYETGELFAGFGFRSQLAGWDQFEAESGVRAYRLELVNRDYYHLDTCFAVLNARTAAYVPEAFTSDGQVLLRRKFPNLLAIDSGEAKEFFCGNCLSLDGKHVVLQKGPAQFLAQLRAHGFTPVEVDTTEFIKAGGSVFCMKQRF